MSAEVREIVSRAAKIRAEIDAALARSAEPRREVTLVAVTKGHPASAVEAVAAAGLSAVGENRVQEAWVKWRSVEAPLDWHMIGHLQRNKAPRVAEFCSYVHSVDSVRLIKALAATGRPLRLFLQVNVSQEASKSGVAPENARELHRAALAEPTLAVIGLMTMAPYSEDPEAARPVFRALRRLRDELNVFGDGTPLRELSMGMSGDFAVAVEEGATFVRIGTALLGDPLDGQLR